MMYFHFKFYRILQWIRFLIELPRHVLFHDLEPDEDFYGWTINGFIICKCGFVEDLGHSYAMHCQKCYDYMIKKYEVKND